MMAQLVSDKIMGCFSQAIRMQPRVQAKPAWLIVACHGASANNRQFLQALNHWVNILPDAAFLLPNAPVSSPVSPSGLANLLFGRRSWFSLADSDEHSLAIAAAPAVRRLNHLIDAELKRLDLTHAQLMLVGFSQGGMMVLGAGLGRTPPPRAVVAISSRLLRLPINQAAARATSIMITHGGNDMIVPAKYGLEAAAELRGLGFDVETHLETRAGHEISTSFLAAVGKHLLNLAASPPATVRSSEPALEDCVAG